MRKLHQFSDRPEMVRVSVKEISCRVRSDPPNAGPQQGQKGRVKGYLALQGMFLVEH